MNRNRFPGCLIAIVILLTACSSQGAGSTNVALPTIQATVATSEPLSSPEPAAGSDSEPKKGNLVLDLTEEQNGSKVTLSVDGILHVVVSGNPTTGFTWETQNLDTSLLQQQAEPVYTRSNTLVGGGGTFDFTFKAIKPGDATLRLIYHRTFEKDTPPARIYEVTVNIQT
ncbi:MAG: protease inhibitor I42 family protein [Chloroflexi bacterium]|nr:protease inhibitor I42 family protein [Chloroflexota bacterium]